MHWCNNLSLAEKCPVQIKSPLLKFKICGEVPHCRSAGKTYYSLLIISLACACLQYGSMSMYTYNKIHFLVLQNVLFSITKYTLCNDQSVSCHTLHDFVILKTILKY